MKKFFTIGMVIILLFLTIVPAFADAASYPIDDCEDFYVYVATPDGGLNFRCGPDVEYPTIITGRIPDGECLLITHTSGNWGRTYYAGEYGWVALKQTSSKPPVVQNVQQVVTEIHTQGVTIVKQVTEVVTEIVTIKETVEPTVINDITSVENESENINNEQGDSNSTVGMIALVGIAILLIIVVAVLLIVIINKSKKN